MNFIKNKSSGKEQSKISSNNITEQDNLQNDTAKLLKNSESNINPNSTQHVSNQPAQKPAKPKEDASSNVKFLAEIVNDVKKVDNGGIEVNSTANPVIHLMENDIKALENNVHLKKMHPKKLKFHKRKYKIDVKNKQLVASTRNCFTSEKTYPFEDLNEVTNGAGSVNLQAFKNKNLNKKEEIDNLAFEIIYDNHKKSLNLMASNQLEKNRWINVLSYLIQSKKTNSNLDWTTNDELLKSQFKKADKGNDKTIDLNEVDAFLESLNLKLKKEQIAALINQADKNKDGKLAEEEFKQFVVILFHRKEMLSLFNLIAAEKNAISIPSHMPLDKFRAFLKSYQKEIKTDEECIQLIDKFEVDTECKHRHQFSFQGFVNYLNDESQYIYNTDCDRVYQNMDLPIFSYYINSSHNTYLTGDQITSTSSADCYRAAIMNGARLVEMDVYDGADNEPRIYHQKTLTSKMKFSDALLIIKEYAFKISDYPLIITIELHCSADQQKVMAILIKKYIGEYLYIGNYDTSQKYPTLNDLKRKIIIRSQMPKVQKNELANVVVRDVQDKIESLKKFDEFNEIRELPDVEEIEEYSSLVNLMQNVSFKGVDYAFENYNQNQTSSLSEQKCDAFIEKEDPRHIIDYTNSFLTKVYPGFFRTDSSNLNPLLYWNLGFQIAALNFQTEDNQMCLNKALFTDNGHCGFVLKPEILRNPLLDFNPEDVKSMKTRKNVEIKIISALNLPQNDEILIKDISDPFVIVNIFGIKLDLAEKKTKSVQDNGFNPIWNETFKFVVNCPELAFVKFTVKDEDIGKDQFIGDFTIRFNNMRPGYRHIKLKNKNNQGIIFVGIKIKPYKEPVKVKEINRREKTLSDFNDDELTKLIQKDVTDSSLKDAINNINELKIGTPVKMSTPTPDSFVPNTRPKFSSNSQLNSVATSATTSVTKFK